MCKLVLEVKCVCVCVCVCVSRESLLTLCIFNRLYFHESQDQNSFSKGRAGRAVSRMLVRGSGMSSGRTFKRAKFLLVILFKCESNHRG